MLRKKPKQDRAEATVSTIFEACAHIIELQGIDKLTTHKIAEKAGFSIGTLYQYFPNKKIIVRALAEMGQKIVIKQMEDFLTNVVLDLRLKEIYPPDLIRIHTQLVLKTLHTESVTSRVAFYLFWSTEEAEFTVAMSKAITDRLMVFLQHINHPKIAQPSAAQLFILVRALAGIMRYSTIEKTSLMSTKQMENELVCLVWGMLRKDDEMERLRADI
jgi:AcrR family transcriptional regulator